MNELIDLDEDLNSHFEVGATSGVSDVSSTLGKKDSQDTKEVGRVFICLSKQAKREHGDGIVTPRSV